MDLKNEMTYLRSKKQNTKIKHKKLSKMVPTENINSYEDFVTEFKILKTGGKFSDKTRLGTSKLYQFLVNKGY